MHWHGLSQGRAQLTTCKFVVRTAELRRFARANTGVDRQWQIADKIDVKWLWKELEMEMSTSDNMGQGLQYKLASFADCDTNFLFPKLVFSDQPVLAELCLEQLLF